MCIRVKSCCCCGSLESGAKAIAIIGMVAAVIGLLGNIATLQWSSIVSSALELAISFCLYYGADKKKTAYVIVWLVIAMIGLVSLGVIFVVCLVMCFVADETTITEVLKHLEAQDTIDPETFRLVLIVVTVILALIFLLDVYLWIVVHSFFKEIQESNYDTSGYVETGGAEMQYKGQKA